MILQQDAPKLHGDYAKSKMKINRKLQTEYLLNNIIDKEIQFMLLPLGIVPRLFLISPYKIINNFITPENPVSCYIKSLVGSCILVLGHLFRLYCFSDVIKHSTSAIAHYVLYFDFIFFSFISVMTHFISSAQRNHIVELIIKLQHVLNSLKINKVKFLSKQKYQNWHSVFMVYSFYVFHSIFAGKYYGFLQFLVNFTLALPMLIFDNHILTATRVVVMIKNELLAWNYVMQKNVKEYIATEEEIVKADVQETDMFDAYDNIIKSFGICNKVYQFLVTYYGFHTFIRILITLEQLLEVGDLKDSLFQTPMMIFSYVAWNMRTFCSIVVLCIACENFYKTVKITESSCAQILSYSQAAGIRKTCKNVLRLNAASLHKMSAFGVFELDAAFPLRLLGGLVAYIVVLLQFAFL